VPNERATSDTRGREREEGRSTHRHTGTERLELEREEIDVSAIFAVFAAAP